jgi:hypothetical protein
VPGGYGVRRLDHLARLDADTQRRRGVVDVEEVAVHGGHRAVAVGLDRQRLALRHLAGEQVVDGRALREVDREAVALEPGGGAGVAVGAVPVEGAEGDARRHRPLPLAGLEPRLDGGGCAALLWRGEKIVARIGGSVTGGLGVRGHSVVGTGRRGSERDERTGDGGEGEQALRHRLSKPLRSVLCQT